VKELPRPIKPRIVCGVPEYNLYAPVNHVSEENLIVMSIEEFETIRLIDHESLDQEECAKRMEVARSTVQRIYNDARKKIAMSLIEGKTLRIEGGSYTICTGDVDIKRCGNCRRNRHGKQKNWRNQIQRDSGDHYGETN
jgi:predicted DNA-binding protein (UPF0251 family)